MPYVVWGQGPVIGSCSRAWTQGVDGHSRQSPGPGSSLNQGCSRPFPLTQGTHMTEKITRCPTCRQWLSERVSLWTIDGQGMRPLSRCEDPVHDLADRAVELQTRLTATEAVAEMRLVQLRDLRNKLARSKYTP